ncbi:MAG: IS200/IS605 family transposase [Anaerolineae bacterium]
MPYWRLHYHLIWVTYRREPLITPPVERQIYGAILGKAQELGIIVHAIGNIEDHVHIAVSIPPKIAVADCVKQFKGASSRYVNLQPEGMGSFKWQEGYGALTFGDRAMDDVVAYVLNQKEHHARGDTRPPYERINEEEDSASKASKE